MSNKIIKDPKLAKLDKNEKLLSMDVEGGGFVKVSNEKDEIERLTNIFKGSTTKSINIRLDEEVLLGIRAKAKASGMPYQTLIKTVLYRYANDKINVAL